jgi:hypothetical protein
MEIIEDWGFRYYDLTRYSCRQSQPSSNSTHDEQLNSSPVRIRTGCPPRIRPFNQDFVPDRSRCVFVTVMLINGVLLFMHHLILFKFQRQVTNVPEHPVHGQVTSVTRIGKLVIPWNYSLCILAVSVFIVFIKINGTGCWLNGHQMQSLTADILNEQFETSVRGWFSSLRIKM